MIKVCIECRKEFNAKAINKELCSKKCKYRFTAKLDQLRRFLKLRECVYCGRGYFHYSPRNTCSYSCSRKQTEKTKKVHFGFCKQCDMPFTGYHYQEYCNAKCMSARWYKIRKDLIKKNWVEDVEFDVVYHKYEGSCGICKKPVDLGLCHPDPDSATIDHIIPLSKDGEHSYKNTQLAHHKCNMKKWDKVE